MNDNNEVSLYNKIVISVAILGSLVALFKAGLVAAIVKFVFVIIFGAVAKALWDWIVGDFFNRL
ncbi:hypothetical protein ACFFLZ_10235 [Photobacterium aphoticum]|uniref:Uncharacterized protein n=1 Tax=Photobacterium aphoticum TaxID=754436 RepID=A0A0J1GFB9_9GAMM|nr:hypothetical protein [Photobacterium aphoticum]KLU98399.1 hypothetical protein ABT58_22825 [Photobacterium aphoticum]PSU55382.1 hypothetical protein C9I90_16515 [Photobacterium aphoticum]GHA67464.1 hypothetical protein GCM10007086_46000 [Photobacterium aphoticum]